MVITTSAILLNAAIIISVWMSQLPLVEKVILAAIVIGKFLLFNFFVYPLGEDRTSKVGCALCILVNAGLVAYSAIVADYIITLTCAAALVLLIVWSFAVIYDFGCNRKE